MANNSSVNLDIANSADGFSIGGGTTKRTLVLTGGNVTITGAGTATYYFPPQSDLMMGSGNFSAGSSISITFSINSLIVSALTGGLVNALTAPYYLVTSGNTNLLNAVVYSSAIIGYRDLPVQAAKLYPSTSAARIDAGTPLWRLLYSATTQQFGIWQFILPRDYSSSPFARILHGNDSSLSVAKSTSWIIDQWGFSPGNTLSAYTDTFGGTNTTTVALSAGYSAGLIQTLTVPLATVVSMNVGNLIRIRVSGSNGAAGNTELFGLNFEYTRI